MIPWITQNYFVYLNKSKKMPKKYFFYSKNDLGKEPINSTFSFSRLQAAKQFANRKQLDLKTFLSLFSVSK
jgi:hypothetical protein